MYHIDQVRHSLDDVKIVSATGEFKLQQDEEIQREEQVHFSDNLGHVLVRNLEKDSCGACSLDSVTGTYEIKIDVAAWVMRPGRDDRYGKK